MAEPCFSFEAKASRIRPAQFGVLWVLYFGSSAFSVNNSYFIETTHPSYLKYKQLSWPVGILTTDADYADYTTDSTFGRAAPNGRGSTDEITRL